MASAAFILLPLVVSRPPSAAGEEIEPPLPSTKLRGWRPFVYFAALGLGFLWIEIPLLQRFILYLDQPTYSFATVLFAVLFWSGVGSLTSRRLGRRRLLAVPATAVLALTYAWALTPMFDAYPGAASWGEDGNSRGVAGAPGVRHGGAVSPAGSAYSENERRAWFRGHGPSTAACRSSARSWRRSWRCRSGSPGSWRAPASHTWPPQARSTESSTRLERDRSRQRA